MAIVGKWVYVKYKTVKIRALYRSFASSSIGSGGIIVFLCFILDDVIGDCFTLHINRKMPIEKLFINLL